MSSKYEKLDALILGALSGVPKRFGLIVCGKVYEEADRIDRESHAGQWHRPGVGRVVDRRLQALKRAGKVQFVWGPRGGWVRADERGDE
ncbi:hypothetical protein [Burkholderia dolosa]|uniref:hypothetical protein n=1 Tax=Burkholderia dolosa TaxID=152500 RepID=UPI00159241D2|nr:hypothetical protein [Burkholderia dolosa]